MKFYAIEDSRGQTIDCVTSFTAAREIFEQNQNAAMLLSYDISVSADSICRLMTGNPAASSIKILRQVA